MVPSSGLAYDGPLAHGVYPLRPWTSEAADCGCGLRALGRLSVIRGPDGRIARIRHALPGHKAANWVGPGRARKSTRPGANGVVELSPFADRMPVRRSSQTLALAATAQGGRGQGWPCRRNASSTGSPISCRRRGSTGIAITEYSRRITGCGKPSRCWRKGNIGKRRDAATGGHRRLLASAVRRGRRGGMKLPRCLQGCGTPPWRAGGAVACLPAGPPAPPGVRVWWRPRAAAAGRRADSAGSPRRSGQ